MISAVIGALVLAAQAADPAEPAVSAPAPAPAVSAATVVGKAPPKDPSQKVVCKTEAPTGSMIPSRVCRTQETWDFLREEGQRATSNIQNRALTVPTAEMNNSAQ